MRTYLKQFILEDGGQVVRVCFSWLTWVVGVVLLPLVGGQCWCFYLGPLRVEWFREHRRNDGE